MNGLQEQNTQLGQLLQNSQQQMAAIQAQMNQMQFAAAMQPTNYSNSYGGRRNGGWGGQGGRGGGGNTRGYGQAADWVAQGRGGG